jgi:hypothetical protein
VHSVGGLWLAMVGGCQSGCMPSVADVRAEGRGVSVASLCSARPGAGASSYGKAVRLHEEALAMRRRVLPEDHLDTASSLNNLALCHRSQSE